MILVGNWGAEEGKDAVAGGLHDEALIAVDRVHHQLQGRIDKAAGRFGVKVFDEGGGILDIGKEGGDGLALAVRSAPGLQRGLLGTDALRQVKRSVTGRDSRR